MLPWTSSPARWAALYREFRPPWCDGRRDGSVEVVDQPGEEGEPAWKAGWPSMMRGYLHEDERYRKCFANGWYLTGDLARCDEHGYFWFVGRADD